MPVHSHANLTEIHAHAVACLTRLLARVSDRMSCADDFDEARAALEALPLTTEGMAIVRNRLHNGETYVQSGEHEAAYYEVLLLARKLGLSEATAPADRPQSQAHQ